MDKKNCGNCRFYMMYSGYNEMMCFCFHSDKFCEFTRRDVTCDRHQEKPHPEPANAAHE